MRWLIDGHNLIGAMPNLQLDDPDDEGKLLEYLRRFRARTGHQITVVFDAGLSYQPGKTIKRGGITIQFASSGKTADQLIQRRVRRVKNAQEVKVVTSDRAVQEVARQAHIRVVSAQTFSRQLLGLSGGVEPEETKGSQADVRLSAEEVAEWLEIFKQRKA